MWSNGTDGVLLDLRQKQRSPDILSVNVREAQVSSNILQTISPHLPESENTSCERLALNCQDCGKSFSHSSSLKRHSRTHTGVHLFICNICNKGFHYKNNLQDHARTHTGEKPFKCPDCGQSFAQSSTLNRHMGTHGKDKCCIVCGKSFVKLILLRKHYESHFQSGDMKYPREAWIPPQDSDKHLNLFCNDDLLQSLQNLCCNKCGKKCDHALDLQQHFWTHFNESNSFLSELPSDC